MLPSITETAASLVSAVESTDSAATAAAYTAVGIVAAAFVTGALALVGAWLNGRKIRALDQRNSSEHGEAQAGRAGIDSHLVTLHERVNTIAEELTREIAGLRTEVKSAVGVLEAHIADHPTTPPAPTSEEDPTT